MKPSQMPVSALDMLNFAFAYIDATTLDIIPMIPTEGEGGGIPLDMAWDLFSEVTSAKLRNPNLQVWVAVGGWSFSDNGTATQPLFGEIAASEELSRKFANQLVAFMTHYNFDGVDIDWEYPGAPDRGGKDRDVENFPKLLGIIREVFNQNGKGRWGISITAPSSYWYLRWFDLPGIAAQCNFINLMSYDLHGIWDAHNEIGPQVLAHTNLTEVDSALELFWRNNIAPPLVNLGIAFYGRSYKLADATCNRPGCAFSGPGEAGDCTNTPGYLSYMEIMDRIDSSDGSTVHRWDEVAGVKYMVYGGDNWISFDDTTTFQQKVDFGNERGLGGMLIWAIDQDDEGRNALKSLTGKTVETNIAQSLTYDSFDISQCLVTGCNERCPEGFLEMTSLSEKNGEACKAADGAMVASRRYCCPPWGAPEPETCSWSFNCNGRCEQGEMGMVKDGLGGDYHATECHEHMALSKRVFCCPLAGVTEAAGECQWLAGSSTDDGLPQYLARGPEGGFWCPEDPDFRPCEWNVVMNEADNEEDRCYISQCPDGQILMTRSNIGLNDIDKPCTWESRVPLCCDPPEAANFNMELDNLFPDAEEIPESSTENWSQALDPDVPLEDGNPNDPDYVPFAWVIMVGPPESVQSLRRRDGSSLETFDCPTPAADDYSTQNLKALCLAESDDHDCEDILLGSGAYGTIVRLPEECGPDEWVRIVSFTESPNATLPEHLHTRATERSQIYEISYDYDLRQASNADEVHIRIDTSTHDGYWSAVVESPGEEELHGRGENSTDWREPHYQWFRRHESRKRGYGASDDWWLNLFGRFIEDGREAVGVLEDYKFDQPLYSANKPCPPGLDARLELGVSGSLLASMDWGSSLIGKVHDTQFEQAYAYFQFRDLQIEVSPWISGEAQFTISTEERSLLSSFAPWGGSFNIKGLVTVAPVMDVKAKLDAILTMSGGIESTVRMALDEGPLTWMYPPSMGFEPHGKMVSDMSPFDLIVGANHEVSLAANGSLAVTITPEIDFEINVDIMGVMKTDSRVTLSAPNTVTVGTGIGDSDCPDGMYYSVNIAHNMSINSVTPLLGWDSSYDLYRNERTIFSRACIPWDSDAAGASRRRRTLSDPGLSRRSEPAVNILFTDSKALHLSCGHDINTPIGECDLWYDEQGNQRGVCAEGVPGSVDRRESTYQRIQQWFESRAELEERKKKPEHNSKGPFELCKKSVTVQNPDGSRTTFNSNRLKGMAMKYPPAGRMIADRATQEFETYDAFSRDNLLDYGFGKIPMMPTKNDGWASEHVLEYNLLLHFLKYFSTLEPDNPFPVTATAKFYKDKPSEKKWYEGATWSKCDYMSFWWTQINVDADFVPQGKLHRAWDHIVDLMIFAIPNKDEFGDEIPLLWGQVNGAKEKSMNAAVNNVVDIQKCLPKLPDQALCALRNLLFVIKYMNMDEMSNLYLTQAQRIASWFDSIEDKLVAYDQGTDKYSSGVYQRLQIGDHFRGYAYSQFEASKRKIETTLDKIGEIEDVVNPQAGGQAGGGTTTGAQQVNQKLLDAVTAFKNERQRLGQMRNPLPSAWETITPD